MKKRRTAHLINGQFVPLLINTINSPAWRAMSHGAKALYIALRRRHNAAIDNNGKIYLPQRVAERELNSKRDYVARWFRELQHYGFIVMVELPYKGTPPTRNFLAWNGVAFASHQKQNPGPQKGAKVAHKRGPKERPTKGGQI